MTLSSTSVRLNYAFKMIDGGFRLNTEPSMKWASCYGTSIRHSNHRRQVKHEESSGRSVASEVFLRLPREIRNRVYTFCVQGSYDNEVIVRRSARAKDKCSFLVRRPSGEHSYHWIEDPIPSMIDAQYLGTEIAREMLETYYWTKTFKFSHYEPLLLISFLTTDMFGLDMFSADYVRHLHLRIHPRNYVYGTPDMRRSEIDKCLVAIKALATVRNPYTDIVVHMDLADCSCDEIDRRDILAGILPDMEQMKKKLNGERMRTRIAYSKDWLE